jgi:hypothetical protein
MTNVAVCIAFPNRPAFAETSAATMNGAQRMQSVARGHVKRVTIS